MYQITEANHIGEIALQSIPPKKDSKSNNILPRFPYKKCIVAVTKGYSSVLVVAGPAELYLFQVFLIIECKSVSV